MSIRVDPGALTPTPRLDPSEPERGMMNMRAVAIAALIVTGAMILVTLVPAWYFFF